MHALKSYSDSSNSEDDKRSAKEKHDRKHGRHLQKYEGKEKRDSRLETREKKEKNDSDLDKCQKKEKHDGHLEKHEKRKHDSHLEWHKRKRKHNSPIRYKHSHSGFRHGERESTDRRQLDNYEERKGRSRSRSPVRRLMHSDKKPDPDLKVEPIKVPKVPPLVQAQAASALLSAQLSQASQYQIQVNKSKQQSIEDKRKLLWSSKKKASTTSQKQWEHATFSEGDSQMQAKFRRLMGMGSSNNSEASSMKTSSVDNKPTEVMKDLEQQYEASRYLTHMARGVGLGYGYNPSDSSDMSK